jgi:hypothetical protein
MIINLENSTILNKTKIVAREGDYVNVYFVVNTQANLNKLWKQKQKHVHMWNPIHPQFLEANLIWQKVHPDLVVSQGWNENKTVYTVKTRYIEARPLEYDWERDAKLYLDLIDVMGFEKTKDDLCHWNIFHGFKDEKPVNYIIDWDEIIYLGSEEKAYNFYKEELCRYQHSCVYLNDIWPKSVSDVEERFDKLWKEKVG